MKNQTDEILTILDRCCDDFSFPMLDNGSVYLAATRLSLYRSKADWALVIEVFGFSPQVGIPDTQIFTSGSRIVGLKTEDEFATTKSHLQYLAKAQHQESRFVFPVDEGPWQSRHHSHAHAIGASEVIVRGQSIPLPYLKQYKQFEIEVNSTRDIAVHEACRYLAAIERDRVLATDIERRGNVPDELEQIMQLEEWHHPDVADDSNRPGGSETFQQLAAVLATGDTGLYAPTMEPNTHWKNWPEGGTL